MQADEKIEKLKIYLKDGKDCFLCASRKKLIRATPEEIVRQEFVLKLLDELNVPPDLIHVEVPMSEYGKGLRGRADIIVSEIEESTGHLLPLVIIECKAPNIPLVDKVFDQAVRYDNELQAKYLIITNGRKTAYYKWQEEDEHYLDIEDLPTYDKILAGKGIKIKEQKESKWFRPNHKDDVLKNREILLSKGNFGEDSSNELVSVITNLMGLIYDTSTTETKLDISGKTKIEDGGIRFTTFGNSAGGSWTADYRYFIIASKDKETEIISLALMGKMSAKNHPKHGNSLGHSVFAVAIDNYENSHLSLQYNIDKFIEKIENVYSFWHDGTLTVGNLGRAKNQEVVEFIKLNSPNLIQDDRIFLGTIDNSKVFTWEDEDVRNLITNFIEYGFIRDKFRKMRKKTST